MAIDSGGGSTGSFWGGIFSFLTGGGGGSSGGGGGYSGGGGGGGGGGVDLTGMEVIPVTARRETNPWVSPVPDFTRPPESVSVWIGEGGGGGGGGAPYDPEIEALNLNPAIREIAYYLKSKHPNIKFTSGFRTVADQARAMAQNVANKRDWILKTNYTNPTLKKALHQWVTDNPEAKTVAQIAEGLLSVFKTFPEEQVRTFSRHTTGDAIDIQPVGGAEGKAILEDLWRLKKENPGSTFLDKEGGRVIWHFQMPLSAPVPVTQPAFAIPTPKAAFAIPTPKTAFAIPASRRRGKTS